MNDKKCWYKVYKNEKDFWCADILTNSGRTTTIETDWGKGEGDLMKIYAEGFVEGINYAIKGITTSLKRINNE